MSTYRPVNRVAEYADESKELMDEYPVSSVLVAFGLGMATGLALMTLFSDSSSRRDQHLAHRLGQQFLDSMSSVLPDTITRNFRG